MREAFDRIALRAPADSEIYVRKSLDISARIYKLLKEKGISQKELAERLGKSESEVSKWLSGLHNFTLKSIAKIEAVLGEKIIEVPKKKKKPKPEGEKNIFIISSHEFDIQPLWGQDAQKASRHDQVARMKKEDLLEIY